MERIEVLLGSVDVQEVSDTTEMEACLQETRDILKPIDPIRFKVRGVAGRLTLYTL